MPAFVTNGPDIPERLLQAHEEGRVVFFCGAGISYPAGLPGFSRLVKELYEEFNVSPNKGQKTVIKAGQFDRAIGLLEAQINGGLEIVRRQMAEILTPKKGASIVTHQALLTLARNRDGCLRLVTTNFDRLFEEALHTQDHEVESFKAPLLPVPKNRWDGLVYLHGLLPSILTDSELKRLVVSSGDFGLAYLTERWAARFVSELFRNYTVCFVGYSINDPVLRYMTDALAADRLRGETPIEMFVFGSYSKGKKEDCFAEWQNKNVTPILYREHNFHAYLHRTLSVWADTYRDGARGKQMIIAQHAITPPLTESRHDFAVGRVLWALTDGLAAKHFANLNPVPPFEWLGPLTEAQFGYDDLSRFGVIPRGENDKKKVVPFSVLERPAPYTHSLRMCLANTGEQVSYWDETMSQLGRWLTRHLNDSRLVLWLAKQGGCLHERLALLIRLQIEELGRLEYESKEDELKCILEDAPNAIPSPFMHTLWRLFLSGRVTNHRHGLGLSDWIREFKLYGLTPTLRLSLRDLLSPRVVLSKPLHLLMETDDSKKPECIKDLVDWEIVLSCEDTHSQLHDLKGKPNWQDVLPDLLWDFTFLLRDALDLMRELGGAEDKSDQSYVFQPSISEHSQNNDYYDWTVLIELARDAWLAKAQVDPSQAALVAKSWWHMPYPLFKRLAFFAAANSEVVLPVEAMEWLLSEDHWWFWSVETKLEMIRLLVTISPKMDTKSLAEIEQAILQGPPREMYKDTIDTDEWNRIVDSAIWIRLKKLHASEIGLGQAAQARLSDLGLKYPKWRLVESDEFPVWMGVDGDWRDFKPTPRRRHDLVEWLNQNPGTDHWEEDDWRQRCSDQFSTTACALFELVQQDKWPINRWCEALQAWSEERLLRRSWRYMAKVIDRAPDHVVQGLLQSLSWWLRLQSKTFEGQEDLFFALIRRLLGLEYEDNESETDLVSRAINHPIGYVTEALLDWWYRQGLKDSDGLKDDINDLFTKLCDTRVDKFKYGRTLLCSHVITLLRVDEGWTILNLAPLFDWGQSEAEAKGAWKGFLRSPRIYPPLLKIIKTPFLETARFSQKLGRHFRQYADFLTFVALDQGDTFNKKELRDATQFMPEVGLQYTLQAIIRAIEGATDQRGQYWRNRILPYLKSIWPQHRNVMTPAISTCFARLCVAAQEAFPEAVVELKHWLQPVEQPNNIIRLLKEADLCQQFPGEALTFLKEVISEDTQWLPKTFKQCLDDIGNADPTLANDPRLVRLKELSDRRGMY